MTTYKGWFGRKARRRCPHSRLRGIYGDEINRHGYRLACYDCGTLLDGRVALARIRREHEADIPEFRMIEEGPDMVLVESTRTGNRVWVPRRPIDWSGDPT